MLKRFILRALAFLLISSFVVLNAKETIKIGAIVAATGPASFLGDPELKTLQHYVAKINAQGGVNGQQIELIHYDTGANPKKAVTFTKRLINQDEVVAIIGPSTTGETMAIIKFVEKVGIPLMSMAGSVAIIDPVKKYVFKIAATDRMACKKVMQDMNKRNLTNLALISGSGGFGKSMRKQCKEVAPSFGVKIVADETYGKKDSDMTSQLLKIKNNKDVQVVLNPGFGQGPAIVTKNYVQLKIKHPLYQSHGVASKKFIEIAGSAAEGVRVVAPPVVVADKLDDSVAIKKVALAYKNEYEKAFNSQVSSFGGHAYDALHVIVDAIKRANSTEPSKIRDAIEKTQGFEGVDGIVNLSATDHLGLDTETGMIMLEIKNGDWTIVK
ncbi:MAG TPA: ABC transporter substrate-binding protein [Sulfurospirillum arcachonense]|nr:ABC transporter substrate-binding protein [Sulfurospirillum arcachonense]